MNGSENFANRHLMHIALREVHSLATDLRFWITLTAIAFVLAVSKPYGTGNTLSFLGLFAYWSIVGLTTYLTAIYITTAGSIACSQRGKPWEIGALLGGIFAGVPISTIVIFINAIVFPKAYPTAGSLWLFALQCCAITLAVTTVIVLLKRVTTSTPKQTIRTAAPSLFNRLSPALGEDIVSLQAQDHYVEVVTTAGQQLILLRMSDAVAELNDVDGARVHRSWWVAKSHARKLERKNGQIRLLLSNGRFVPVSRSKRYIARALVDT